MRYVTWNDNLGLYQNDGFIRRSKGGQEHRFRFYELILGKNVRPDTSTPEKLAAALNNTLIDFSQDPEGAWVTSTNDKRLNIGHTPEEAAYKLSTSAYLPTLAAGATPKEGYWYKVLAADYGDYEVGTIFEAGASEAAIAGGTILREMGEGNAIAAGLNLFFVEAPDVAVTDATVIEDIETEFIVNNIYKVASGTVIYKGVEYQTGEFFSVGSELPTGDLFGEGTDGVIYRYQPEPYFSSLSENTPMYEEAHFKQKVLGSGKEVAGYNVNRIPPAKAHPVGTVWNK